MKVQKKLAFVKFVIKNFPIFLVVRRKQNIAHAHVIIKVKLGKGQQNIFVIIVIKNLKVIED